MKKRIGVVGVGLIGQRHAQAVHRSSTGVLSAVVDPSPVAAEFAEQLGVRCFTNLDQLLDSGLVDGVVLSTPNEFHVQQALDCIAAKLPVLVEKPLAVDLAGARAIVNASESAGIAVLTGHHRRHNPLISRARQLISEGALGRITAVQATTWFYKPDDYFNVGWRTQPGAGPVYLNLIHDIDMLRHLCGEIVQVQAMESSSIRGHAVEDTAVILLRFDHGALGTLSVSDCTVSPWSWEFTSRENPAFPVTNELCCQIGGTQGSLAIPDLSLWQYPQKVGWMEPISALKQPFAMQDPLIRQIDQLVSVIKEEEAPLVSARDGMINQEIIEAVKRSAATHRIIDVSAGLQKL